MSAVGLYNNSSAGIPGINSYMGSASQGGNVDISTVMPALMNVINQAGTKMQTPAVQSAIEEHKDYWQGLTNDTRFAIEADPEYQQLKMQLLQEFLLWCIGGTELGIAFSNGPGATTVRNLTALAKKLEPQVSKQREQEVENLRKQVAHLTQIINQGNNLNPDALQEVQKLRNEMDCLKRNLGEEETNG